MDTVSDNPLKRFSSFWLGLILFGAFGVLCLVLGPYLTAEKKDPAYQAAADKRLAVKAEMEAAQAESLKVDPVTVFAKTGAELLSVTPGAVRDNAQVVPGSVRAEALAAAPGETVEIVENDPNAAIDPAVMEAGKGQYILCQACHGPDGEGIPNLAPPLAGSEWVNGPVVNLIRIQLRGLMGPITVKGTEYKFAAPMVAQAFQTDEQVAAVLTYVRNSFGNKASAVTPDQVNALRGEVGKPPLTVEDLIPPTPQP
jgi:mono/diheme cytochrome c family protein